MTGTEQFVIFMVLGFAGLSALLALGAGVFDDTPAERRAEDAPVRRDAAEPPA